MFTRICNVCRAQGLKVGSRPLVRSRFLTGGWGEPTGFHSVAYSSAITLPGKVPPLFPLANLHSLQKMEHIASVRRRASAMLPALLCGVLFSPAHGTTEFAPSPVFDAALSRLAGENLIQASTRFTPRIVNTAGPFQGSVPGIQVGEALTRIYQEMEDMDSVFVYEGTDADTLGNTHVRLRQTWRDVPVFGAHVIVHLGRDNLAFSITGFCATGLNVSVDPKLRRERIVEIVGIAMGSDVSSRMDTGPVLSIFGKRLAYEVGVTEDESRTGSRHFLVDANSGEILFRFSEVQP